MKRYSEISFSTIEEKWNSSTNPIGVYIHSPFCPSICKFCIYAGTIQKHNSEYTEYFEQYLPEAIELYSHILSKKYNLIKNWFFGGGTPSLMLPNTLRDILNSLPKFKTSKGFKTFEIHPAYWTTGLLDVLQEFNFDVAVICLQTYDRKTLISQNRVPAKSDDITNLAIELRARNIKVFIDVIAFLNQEDDDENILKNDLEIIYNSITPDEISIQTVYQNKNYTKQTIDCVLNSQFVSSNDYKIQFGSEFLSMDKINYLELCESNWTRKCFRLVKYSSSKSFIGKINNLFMFMDPQHQSRTNKHDTLAIGSYKNKSTQSHSNISSFNYIETNVDNIAPKFYFVKNSFFDEIQIILDIMKELGEPEGGFELKLTNEFYCINESPIILKHQFYGSDTQYVDNLQNRLDDYCSIITNCIK